MCIEILALAFQNSEAKPYRTRKNDSHLQEQYVDDFTILEYAKHDEGKNAENVKYIIKVLDEFYVISGLGITKSKTQLSLFACDLDKSELAKSLGLKWCHKFTLLGIDFDQCLFEMDQNFEICSHKHAENCKKNWRYSYLTVFEKYVLLKLLCCQN